MTLRHWYRWTLKKNQQQQHGRIQPRRPFAKTTNSLINNHSNKFYYSKRAVGKISIWFVIVNILYAIVNPISDTAVHLLGHQETTETINNYLWFSKKEDECFIRLMPTSNSKHLDFAPRPTNPIFLVAFRHSGLRHCYIQGRVCHIFFSTIDIAYQTSWTGLSLLICFKWLVHLILLNCTLFTQSKRLQYRSEISFLYRLRSCPSSYQS